jgi:RNA polymerase sigma-70 factor (ECF subfamily)
MEALSVLFQRYSRLMFGIALRVLQNRDEAEDLVQDVFLFLLFKGRLFDPAKGRARSWILQVTYHRAFDRRKYLNARSFYDRIDASALDSSGLLPSSGDNLEEFVAWQTCLRPAFEQLSDDQRKALMLRFYEGYTIREISEKLGQSVGNVQHHLYRGLDRLRRHVFRKNGNLTDLMARNAPPVRKPQIDLSFERRSVGK